jgi:predicted ATPase/signal transduction histidine kinase/ActR/RegA family two-component response regulator
MQLKEISFEKGEELYRRDKTEGWYRGVDKTTGGAVSLQVYSDARDDIFPYLERQFQETPAIQSPFVLLPVSLLRVGKDVVVVYEGAVQSRLSDQIKAGRFKEDPNAFLTVAIQLAEGLQAIHKAGLVFHGLSCHNVVFLEGEEASRLQDFSLANALNEMTVPLLERKDLPLQWDLHSAYLAPEESGGLLYQAGPRSDKYSLGALFYEMLCLDHPFKGRDQEQLVYAHRAKQVMFPEGNTTPKIFQDIVLALLQKNVEARYHTLDGLLFDLRKCQEQLASNTTIDSFKIKTLDVTSQFQLSSEFCGREREVRSIVEKVAQVQENGSSVLFIAGQSGIGKSALMEAALHKLERRVSIVRGKFDQVPQSPLDVIRHAFRNIIAQSADPAALQKKISEALNGSIVAVKWLLPELASLVPNEKVSEAAMPGDEKHRFDQVLESIVAIITQELDCLIIFFDDLQWANQESITLLKKIMCDFTHSNLLFVGTYRAESIDENKMAAGFIETLNKSFRRAETLALEGLSTDEVGVVLSNTLFRSKDEVAELAECLHRKTKGFPLALNEFLMCLYGEGLIAFHAPERQWVFDLAQIEKKQLPDNMVAVVSQRIEGLPLECKSALLILAMMGCFVPEDLYYVVMQAEMPGLSVMDLLAPARVAGIVEQRNGDLLIVHDKVQEVLLTLPLEVPLQEMHLKIGRALLRGVSPERYAAQLIGISQQFVKAKAMIVDQKEKQRLAVLFVEAATMHKNMLSYPEALVCLEASVEMKGAAQKVWEEDYEFTASVHYKLAEMHMLLSDLEESEKIIRSTLDRVKTPIEKANLLNMLVVQYTLKGRYEEALRIAHEALAFLQIELAASSQATLFSEIGKVGGLLGAHNIKDLKGLDETVDNTILCAMKILSNMVAPAFGADPFLQGIITSLMVELTIKHGPCAQSSNAFGFYGVILSAFMSQHQAAYDYCQLGVFYSERFGDLSQRCLVGDLLTSLIGPYCQPIQTMQDEYPIVYKAGLSSAQYQYYGYQLSGELSNRFFHGSNKDSISDLVVFAEESIRFLFKTNNVMTEDTVKGLLYPMELLQQHLGGRGNQYESDCLKRKNFLGLVHYYVAKAKVEVILRDYTHALASIKEAEGLLQFAPGFIINVTFNLAHSLTLLGNCTEENKPQSLAQVEQNQLKLDAWQKSCPQNFLHLFLLVKAEEQRVKGEHHWGVVFDLYDSAIKAALANGFQADAALAYECSGRFLLSLPVDMGLQANQHLKMAHALYKVWGAEVKTSRLEKEFLFLKESLTLQGNDLAGRRPSWSSRSAFTPSPTTSVLERFSVNTMVRAVLRLSQLQSRVNFIAEMFEDVARKMGATRAILWESTTHDGFEQTYIMKEGVFSPRLADTVCLEGWKDECGADAIIAEVVDQGYDLCLSEACLDDRFRGESRVVESKLMSAACFQVRSKNHVFALVYLENHSLANLFNADQAIVTVMLQLCATFLERLQNAEEKRHFISKAGHDALNPLQGIIASKETISEAMKKLEGDLTRPSAKALFSEITDSLASMTQCTAHQKNVLEDTIRLYELEEGGVDMLESVFDLNEMMTDFIDTRFPHLLHKGCKIEVNHLFDDSALIFADSGKCIDMLRYIISYSLGASPTNINITLTSRILMGSSDALVTLSIVDNAGNHSPRQLSSPIIPLHLRVANEYSGSSGLELNIVRQLVHVMSGELFVESSGGDGCRYTLSFRCKKPSKSLLFQYKTEKLKKKKSFESVSQLPLDKIKVLVAEDNLINRKVIVKALENKGYQVIPAEDGRIAEATFRHHQATDDPIKFIFMDIKMPHQDGHHTAKNIRQFEDQEGRYTTVPIMALTADLGEEHRLRAHASGMNGYNAKPYQWPVIFNLMEDLLVQFPVEKLREAKNNLVVNKIVEFVVDSAYERLNERGFFSRKPKSPVVTADAAFKGVVSP